MLPDQTELLQLFDNYLRRFPDELATVSEFRMFLKRNPATSVFDRRNFDGHFTASAFLLDTKTEKLLFLKHKKLGRWLQPGGHIDETDNTLLAAALREITEETGLQYADLKLVRDDIFDLDAHQIPANSNKAEPAHVHYDIRFLLEVTNEAGISLNDLEAEELAWLPFAEVQKLEGFGAVINKIKTFLND